MIELRHLRKEYANCVPLKDVNVTINDGDIISVIGPSGTGKSTFIRCINLLEKPTSGQIIVDGHDITAPGVDVSQVRRKIGMVFQNFNLFAHMTVLENVMYGPVKLYDLDRQEAYNGAMELLHAVGLEDRAMNYPDMLSGGQKQRVAIARTLAMDPDVILFDEPTSALDPTMVKEVQAVISYLTKLNKTMIIVTHEMRFAREISNRVLYMDQGGIYEDGPPEQVFDSPKRDRTRRFINQIKASEIIINSQGFDFISSVSDLDRYGYINKISPKTMYRIQSVFEELCQQILLPHFAEPKIMFSLEYNENQEMATLIFRYAGESFMPLATENKLALSIVNKQIESMSYSYDETSEYQNGLVVKLR